MTPTKVKLINKIEKFKEMIMQNDQQMQDWKNKLISLNQIIILMNEAMTKALVSLKSSDSLNPYYIAIISVNQCKTFEIERCGFICPYK
jgi:hypothetical protein